MRSRTDTSTLLLLITLCLLSCAGQNSAVDRGDAAAVQETAATAGTAPVQGSGAPSPAEDTDLLSNLCAIGASVTVGYGLQEVNLSDLFDLAIKTPHQVTVAGHELFFMGPDFHCRNALSRLKKSGATVAVGIDFFFWFAYGFEESLETRQELLRRGLAFAEQIECPFIAGDIPDMREAAGGILHHGQVPSVEELKILNAQLRAWAAGRPHVHILPLSEWMENLRQGRAVEVNGTMRTFTRKEILQADRLHTNERGMALLTVKCLEAMIEHYPEIDRDDLVLDMDELYRRTMEVLEELLGSEAL